MNKLFSLVILSLFSIPSQAQQVPAGSFKDYNQHHFEDSAYLETNFSGGIITNFLTRAMVTENYWTNDIISKQVEQLTNVNRMGFQFEGEVLIHGRKSISNPTKLTLLLGLKHNFISAFSANRAVTSTLLEGNKNNRSLNFDQPNKYDQLRISSLNIGGEWLGKDRNSKQQLYVSLVGGHNFTRFVSTGGEVVTDSLGESIRGQNTDISYRQNTSAGIAGFGAALNYRFIKKTPSGLLGFHFENLGILKWNNTDFYQLKSNFEFSGFDVTQAIKLATEVNFADSLNDAYVTKTNESFTTILPFRAELTHLQAIRQNAAIESKLSYTYFTGYWPLLESSYKQPFSNSAVLWKLGARIGGFGNYGLNMGVDAPIGRKGGIRFDFVALESLISNNLPVYWYGNLGLFFRL